MTEVNTKLYSIFQLVNDWLKYAEAKNGGLLVACGAAAAALSSYLSQSPNTPLGWKRLLLSSVGLFILSALMALISFLPRTNANYILALLESWGKPADDDNLYYFRHLCKYTDGALLDRLTSFYLPDSNVTITRDEQDLARQIIIISRLTVVKLRMFTVGTWLALIAGLLIIGGLLYEALF